MYTTQNTNWLHVMKYVSHELPQCTSMLNSKANSQSHAEQKAGTTALKLNGRRSPVIRVHSHLETRQQNTIWDQLPPYSQKPLRTAHILKGTTKQWGVWETPVYTMSKTPATVPANIYCIDFLEIFNIDKDIEIYTHQNHTNMALSHLTSQTVVKP